MKARDWNTLIHGINEGQCVLFVGPDISVVPDSANGGGNREVQDVLANHLKQELDRPEDAGPDPVLPLASQLYINDVGRTPLQFAVADFYRELDGKTTPLHESLAKLPFRLCLSISPDRFMASALKNAGKNPIEEYFNYKESSSADITFLDDPARPTVYQLFGCTLAPSSMVLTENDLLEFLVRVVRKDPALPASLVTLLRSKKAVFLFVGFGLCRWHLRILLRMLDQEGTGRDNNSFAVESDEGLFEDVYSKHDLMTPQAFFKLGHRIAFGDLQVDEFIKLLAQKYETSGTQPTAKAQAIEVGRVPTVFLSHDSIDKQHVVKLAKRLRDDGINTWVDQENIRGGSRWEDELDKALKGTDYFLFIQSNLTKTAKLESWWRPELKYAKRRAGRFPPGYSFLIPLRIDDCELVTDVEEYQRIDYFDENGYQTLRKTIKRDWQKRLSGGFIKE